MLCKRIIPCLDVANGRTVKGVKFEGLRDMGDPVAMGIAYQDQGADELVFLDITASVEDRSTTIQLVQRVARELMIPFTVGGGIRTVEDAYRLLEAGADKVSVNTAAVTNPQLITDIAKAFGNQCCVLAIDARRRHPRVVNITYTSTTSDDQEWDVLTHGGRKTAEMDALSWAQHAVDLGAGEILLTSWDADGTRQGFDIALTKTLATQVAVPVIASGGAHNAQSFVDVFTDGYADAALAASLFHDGDTTVQALKETLAKEGIAVRL